MTIAISIGSGGLGAAPAGVEAAAVLRRPDCEHPQERSAHRLGRAEAASARDLRDGLTGLLEAAPGRLQPDSLHVAPWCEARLSEERAGEVPRAHVGPRRHRLDRVRPRGILEDVPL